MFNYLQKKVQLISHQTILIQLHHGGKSSWERCRSLALWIWDNSEQVLAESWIIQVNNPWLNHDWLWSHRSTRYCTRQIFFYGASVFCGGADEIGETEFASRRFLRVRYKKLSTSQNQGITWQNQGTLETRLPYNCRDTQRSIRRHTESWMEQMFHNQSTYRLRRLNDQRTKLTAVDETGRARKFCWLLESDWTREVRRFNLNHLDKFHANQTPVPKIIMTIDNGQPWSI